MTGDERPSGEDDGQTVGPLGRVVIRGVGLSGAGFFLTQAITLASSIVLARLTSPEAFGLYASATILLGYTGMFVDSGMAAALIQRRDRIEDAASTAFAANVAAGLLLSLAAAASAPLIGLYFQSATVEAVAAVMAGIVALDALLLVPDALLQRRFSFLRRLVLSPSSALTFGVAAGVACGLGLGVWGLVIGRYASVAVEVLLIWGLIDWRPQRERVSFEMWRSLASFGRHIFATAFLTQFRNTVRTALLGRLVSIDAVGQYRVADMLANFPRTAWVVSSAYVVFPAFAQIAHDVRRFEAALRRTIRWMGIVTLPASALLIPLGPAIAVLLLGDRWRPAGYAIMAMAGIPLSGGLVSVLSEAAKGAGRPDVLSRTALFTGVATPALLAAFVPLGLVGIAGAGSLASLAGACLLTRLVVRALGFPLRSIVDALCPSLLATSALLGAVFPLQWLFVRAETHGTASGLALLLAEVALGAAVYLVVLRLLDPAAIATMADGARLVLARLRSGRGQGRSRTE